MFNDKYLPTIRAQVETVRKQYGLDANAPIGDYIFTVLKNECILLEWPEDKQLDLDGFSTEKVINGKIETIVYINSAKNKEKQNFCVAHELGHRYKLDVQIKDQFPEEIIIQSDIEDIMNRFAAELLMPESDFYRRGKESYEKCLEEKEGKRFIHVKKLIQAVIQLMDFYFVPYKSVVLRLYEVGIIPKNVNDYLQKIEQTDDGKDVVALYIKESGITRLRTPDKKKQCSVSLDGIYDIVSKHGIMKYMRDKELSTFLSDMGYAPEDKMLIEEMRKIELETIEIDKEENRR